MNKLIIFTGAAMLALSSCTKEQVDQVLNTTPANIPVTNEEAVAGLKEALNVGTDTSVSILHKLDGYYRDELVKILLPAEAQVVYEKISVIPGGQALLDQTILTMNRAAEDAAVKAKPIFLNAITGMTITDGIGILKGSDTSATAYLNGKTYTSLKNAFQPPIDSSLAKEIIPGFSAASSYTSLINAYNTASFGGSLWPMITTNSLSDHVTRKALDGLFVKVADEEKSIRRDPLARVTDLLKRVFGSL